MSNKNIADLFFHGLLAEAAYSDFVSDDIRNSKFTGSKETILREYFNVIKFQPETSAGFSATLFEEINSSNGSKYKLAIRGSQEAADFIDADKDIMFRGIPYRQIVDLYNFTQKLKTPSNQKYLEAKMDLFKKGITFSESEDYGLDKANEIANVDLTGHSLGGALVAAFGRLFPNNANLSYTINGAGVPGEIHEMVDVVPGPIPVFKPNPFVLTSNELFKLLNGRDSFPQNETNFFNMFAADGVEIVTNDFFHKQLGQRLPINIEYGFPGADHKSGPVFDSLAVAWIFNKLDSNYSLAEHSAIVDAAQASESGSLLKLTKALHFIVQGSEISDFWDGVYNISQLNQTANIKVLATLSHQELLEYYQNSGSKKALIYSAHNGLPFAVEGAYSAYDSIDENQYSSEAIYDLMAKLATELNIYTRDSSSGNELGVGNAKFSLPNDVAIENEESANPLAKRDVVFGSEASDVVSGTAQDNRLYGLGGSDTLNGSDDRDILDGGNDEDKLFGNGGNDLLIGGKGDDELDGGEGNDTLDGGEGNDTYLFTSESGHDVIEKYNSVSLGDSDGVIKYHDKVIDGSGAKKKSEQANIFYDKDEKVTYSKFDNNLLIEFEEDNEIVSSVTIRGFKNGNLGINLPENKEEPEDNTLDKYVATEVFQSNGNFSSWQCYF